MYSVRRGNSVLFEQAPTWPGKWVLERARIGSSAVLPMAIR